MSDSLVSVENVSKSFDEKPAVDNLSFSLPRGSVCGIVGPNGAGKTTTIKMLLGLYPSDSGRIRVLGFDPATQSLDIRRSIGYVPEQHHIYDWITVKDCLGFVSNAFPSWNWDECRRVSDILALPQDLKVKDLSRGELAKLALTIALGHEPELLILDEPTSGLDPLIRMDFLESIIDIIKDGKRSVFFSTHILSDVERVADHIIVMDKGEKILDDSLEAAKAEYKKVSFIVKDAASDNLDIPEAESIARGLREVVAVFHQKTESDINSIAKRIGADDTVVQDMPFEDVFLDIMKRRELQADD